MTSKTLSSFRLHTKAISTDKEIRLNNRIFSILKSISSKNIIHFYVLDMCWSESGDQIFPLAHLVVSSKTGNIKFNIIQPEVFNLQIDLDKLSKIILDFIFES